MFSNSTHIDIKGFTVFYGNKTYECLQMYLYTEARVNADLTSYSLEKLRIAVINSDGRFEVLDDTVDAFYFEKE